MMKKSYIEDKVRAKLHIAFFILYYFDPISFHFLQSSGQKKTQKAKQVLSFKLNCLKFCFYDYSNSLIHCNNENINLLLIKNFLIILENFKSKAIEEYPNNLKKQQKLYQIKQTACQSFIFYNNSSVFLISLNCLDDYLNV